MDLMARSSLDSNQTEGATPRFLYVVLLAVGVSVLTYVGVYHVVYRSPAPQAMTECGAPESPPDAHVCLFSPTDNAHIDASMKAIGPALVVFAGCLIGAGWRVSRASKRRTPR